jgi:hypothetical protein
MCRDDWVLWLLQHVCVTRHSTRGLGGHLEPDVMKTKAHILGLDV